MTKSSLLVARWATLRKKAVFRESQYIKTLPRVSHVSNHHSNKRFGALRAQNKIED